MIRSGLERRSVAQAVSSSLRGVLAAVPIQVITRSYPKK